MSWLLTEKNLRQSKARKFLLSPYLSIRSLNYHVKRKNPFLKLFLFSTALAIFISLTRTYFTPLSGPQIILFSPVIYLLTEFIGAFGQSLFYGTPSFSIHKSPLKASSLSHFWGRDWNVWVQDWLRDISGHLNSQHRVKKIFIVFMLSGLFHEVMCNLPYYIYYKKSYFGTMMIYFLIQGIALWIDKKFVRHAPKIFRRIYLWLAVILPSPLFVNVPLLTFFGISYE